MLKPSMQELLNRVGNRYLLVNLTAQRARDISDEAEEIGEKLRDKSVKLALDEIADGSIIYQPGPRVEHHIPTVPAPDLSGTLDIDLGEEEESEETEDVLFEEEIEADSDELDEEM